MSNPLLSFGQLMAGEIIPAPAATNSPVPSFSAIDGRAAMNDFANRLRNLETAIKLQVPNDRIISMIALTTDTALISSDKIALVGEVTFFDWARDVSGVASGTIDPSITQIRGGVIRTGKVASLDGNSWIDLDATGTTPFIKGQTAVSILANGNFSFGSGSSALTWNGSTLSVGSATLLSGTATSTVVSNASAGAAESGAYSLAASKLAASSSYTLTGVAQLSGTGGVMAGSVTWNSSTGVVTGGSGIVMTQNGITGVKAGAVTFSIDNSGSAVFRGDIDGGGYINAAGVYNTTIATVPTPSGSLSFKSSITGTNSSTTYPAGTTGIAYHASNVALGVLGVATGPAGIGCYGTGPLAGVAGYSTVSGGAGVYAVNNTAGGLALVCSSTSGVAFSCTGVITLASQTIGTGAATGSLLANKPGSASNNTWLTLAINGTTYYLPIWT